MGDSVLEALAHDEAYSVVKILAEKASGSTELVSSPGGRTLYVRKRIPVEIANREAWAKLARIDDRYLPRVIEMYELPDRFVVVCEYVEGYSLAESVDCTGGFDAAKAVDILEGVCRAAGVLHGHGIVHRDISPSNVIVAADGAHLIDLGIARVGDSRARHDTTKLGTWGFAAPEQYGFAQTDARSDVYSIGCLAAYLLTGIRPGEEGFEQADAGLPTGMRACIDKARSFEPSARYQSAAEFLAAFRAACVEQAGPAPVAARIRPVFTGEMPDQLKSRRGFLITFTEIADAWTASSLAKRLATVALLPWAALFCGGMISATFKAFARDGAAAGLVGLIMTLFLSWVILEMFLMNLKAGPYARASSRLLTLLKRGGALLAIGFTACFVLALIERFILAVLTP